VATDADQARAPIIVRTGAAQPYPGPLRRPVRGSAITRILRTTDAERIGLMYLTTPFGLFLVGGLMALLMRAELARPGMQILSSEQYNQLFTMHGTIMLLLFATPIVFAFASFVVPLQIGAPDVSFPRLNAFAYWLYLFGGLIVLGAFLTPAGGERESGSETSARRCRHHLLLKQSGRSRGTNCSGCYNLDPIAAEAIPAWCRIIACVVFQCWFVARLTAGTVKALRGHRRRHPERAGGAPYHATERPVPDRHNASTDARTREQAQRPYHGVAHRTVFSQIPQT
jgi:hypothetical protein